MRRASRRTGCSSGDVRGPLQNSQGHVTSSWMSTIKENKTKVKRRERVDLRGKDSSSQRWIFLFFRGNISELQGRGAEGQAGSQVTPGWHLPRLGRATGGQGSPWRVGLHVEAVRGALGGPVVGARVAAGRFASTGLTAGAKLPYCSQGRTAARAVPEKPGLFSSPCGV